MDSLAAYLATLTKAERAEIVAQRPDVGRPAPPTNLATLAARLGAEHSVVPALVQLTRPGLQVAEALAALGPGCTTAELAAAFGVAEEDPGLTAALADLKRLTIAWPDVRTPACGHPGCAGIDTVPLENIWPEPYGLGPPLVVPLNFRRAEELRAMARLFEVPARPVPGQRLTKDDLLAEVAAWLRDPTNVRRLVAGAPAGVGELLGRLAWDGPYHEEPYFLPGRLGQESPARWAYARGLLGPDHWDGRYVMPAEVALALRGPKYHLPFDPVPPSGATVEVSSEAVEREGAAAACAALAKVAALLEECSTTPVAALKNGGVGVRELRRLAKATGDDEEHLRLWLEIAHSADLITEDRVGAAFAPTPEYDEWRRQEPAEQLVILLESWRALLTSPLWTPAARSARPAPLGDPPAGQMVPDLRGAALGVAATLPPAAAVPSVETIVEVVSWLRPVAADAVDDLTGQIRGLWREAELLGLVAHHAPTNLGLALADGDRPTMLAVARRMLPAALDTVLIQADLTAVVTGTPSLPLLEVLDRTAERESRGGAWMWRFTAATVTRAFDAGASAGSLLADLRAVVPGGELPQALEYLIADVERRHGMIRVRPVGCVLHCPDEALLAEILKTRALAPLGLAELAPTVLASTAPPERTLAALRAAGYAPAGENPDGSRALEVTPQRRVEPLVSLRRQRR